MPPIWETAPNYSHAIDLLPESKEIEMSRSTLLPLLLVSVVLFALSLSALAQGARPVPGGYSISGQVRLAQGGAAAELALVSLESFRGGVVAQVQTDRTGKFRFPNLTPG